MPTHQGKTHTDILIGGGGENAQKSSEFEFFANYATTASLEYRDLAPETDRCYSGYELLVRNSAGSVIATFAARYKAWIDRGSCTGPKSIDIVNKLVPPQSGKEPSWPSSPVTTAAREWRVDAFDAAGNIYAKLCANWQLRTTVASGATVIQTVTDQSDSLLRVHLLYQTGRTIHLDVVATMTATAAGSGVVLDPPDVSDQFTP